MTSQASQVIAENKWGEVQLEPIGNGLQQLVIHHQQCQARVSLYGGQVLAWQPSGEEEVFWLSKNSAYEQGKAIRGGIPLCWPWFGGYKDGGNHGFARQVTWQCKSVEVLSEQVIVELCWQGENQHSLWPHKAKVTQTLMFGQTFKQTLTIENLSNVDVEFTAALHSYFSVSHPEKVAVPALDEVAFDCKLTGDKAVTDKLANIVGPIDRVYYFKQHSNQPMAIIDKGLGRTIELTTENVNNWVLWNPGSKIAAEMADVHEHGEHEYICLEAANTDWQKVAAGHSASFSQHIRLRHC